MLSIFNNLKIIILFLVILYPEVLFSTEGPNECSYISESINDAQFELSIVIQEPHFANLYTKADAENLAPFSENIGKNSWRSISVEIESDVPKLHSVPVDISITTTSSRATPNGQFITTMGRPYTFVKPNGDSLKVYIADQKLFVPVVGSSIDPIEQLNLAAKKLGHESLEIVPLTKNVNGKIEHVQGGVRKIYLDKKSGDLYKYNINNDPYFTLNMRTAEILVTRYSNKVFENSIAELGLDISFLPHNYTFADFGWSSQKKIKGLTLYQYRKSLSKDELSIFNQKLSKLKEKLAHENITVAKMINQEMPGTGHIYKGLSTKNFDILIEWQINNLASLIASDISVAVKNKDYIFMQEIMQRYGTSSLDLKEMNNLSNAINRYNDIPSQLRSAVDEYVDLAHERALYLSFDSPEFPNPFAQQIKDITKQINILRSTHEKKPLFKEALLIKKDIYSLLAPKIPESLIQPNMFKWATNNGYLADIDTGLIHLNSPYGRPSDLNNCLITGIKIIEGKTIEVIECFDSH